MIPRKKGQKYEISYRCPNYEKPFSERFDSYEAAKLRIAQIEYERSLGVFEPPKQTIIAPKKDHYVTVVELLDEYVQLYGLKHWGDSYLSSSQHFIAHYIKQAGNRRCFSKRCDDTRSGRLLRQAAGSAGCRTQGT